MLLIGTLLQNRYRIEGKLGQGGMASVHKAQDGHLNRKVAIKERAPAPNESPQESAQTRDQFWREAEALAILSHPNLPQIYDYFQVKDSDYVVMELIDGESLEHIIHRLPSIDEMVVRRWAAQLLDALKCIHAKGLVHRDIKPANIILKEDGRVVLVDFGLVKVMSPQNPYTAPFIRGMGTAEYAPLEQYSVGMHTDVRSDIYALGATLYHMLAGRAPLDAAQRNLNPMQQPALRLFKPNLSSQMETAVNKAMQLNPADRYQSADEMLQALKPPEAIAQPKLGVGPAAAGGAVPPMIPAAYPAYGQPVMPPAAYPAMPPSPFLATAAPLASGSLRRVYALGIGIIILLVGIIVYLLSYKGTFTNIAGVFPTASTTSAPTVVSTAVATPGAAIPEATIGLPNMVPVPAGEFTMGSGDGEFDEKPAHQAVLDAFQIDRFEVTNEQYKRCVDAGNCEPPAQVKSNSRSLYYGNSQFNNYPVIYVSWNQADRYCRWAGKRLPTEAEWEKAARGADAWPYPWGRNWDKNKLNWVGMPSGDTTSVGSFPGGASVYGAMDMVGNVWEWVSDWYSSAYYTSATVSNPKGPSQGSFKVLRSSSWQTYFNWVRTYTRNHNVPGYQDLDVGFRCAQ